MPNPNEIMQPIIELRHVKKEYLEPYTQVLENVTLQIPYHQSIALVGPSGSGKTTILNMIAGLEPPTEGKIFCYGQDLSTYTENELCKFRNQKIGFIFQDHHLLPQCTALENVLLPQLATQNVTNLPQSNRAKELLSQVGLAQRMHYYPRQLSGGERQRVAIARALLHNPALILADEPTGALDQKTATQVMELLLQLHKDYQNTLLLVTHHTAWEKLTDHVYQLVLGHIEPKS